MSKRKLFLSDANIRAMIRNFYQRHIADGGKLPSSYMSTVVPQLMKSWDGIAKAEAYESVDGDLVAELQAMNRDFLIEKQSVWFGVQLNVRTMPETVEGYRQLDFGSPTETLVTRSQFRRENRPLLLQQKMHGRHIDRKDGSYGIRFSHTAVNRGFDMKSLLSAVEKPYSTARTLDADPLYRDLESSSSIPMQW